MFEKMCTLVQVVVICFSGLNLYGMVDGQWLPATPCPNVFQYRQFPNGDVYGLITLPFDRSTTLNLGVNASMKGYYVDSRQVSLKITIDTPGQEIVEHRANSLRYTVKFPFQHTIPKITRIKLNNVEYCRGPPEELIPGEPGVTSLWAGHQYHYQTPSRIGIPDTIPSSFKPVEQSVQQYERQPEITNVSPQPQQPDKSGEPYKTGSIENHECGIVKNRLVSRVVGGSEISDGTYPWLAAMFTTQGTGYTYKCTASLLSEKHVITAARCLNYYTVQIVQTTDILFVFGKSNLQNWAVNAVTRGASKIHTYPDFDQVSGNGDISVVTLDRSLQFTSAIAPICLWSGNSDFTGIVDKTGTVAGWGADEVAQKAGQFSVSVAKSVNMPVVPQDKCFHSNSTPFSSMSDMTFCAGKRNGAGTCVGDYGSGFMMNLKGKFYLRGLASILLNGFSGECDQNLFMIFCDVAKFNDWIKSVMKD